MVSLPVPSHTLTARTRARLGVVSSLVGLLAGVAVLANVVVVGLGLQPGVAGVVYLALFLVAGVLSLAVVERHVVRVVAAAQVERVRAALEGLAGDAYEPAAEVPFTAAALRDVLTASTSTVPPVAGDE